MAKNKRKGGSTTPKGTRPEHLRPVREPELDASPVDGLIDSGARGVLDEDAPLAAESWASGLLDMFESARWQARLAGEEVPPFEEAILERCRQRRDRRALVVAAGLAAALPSPLDGQARQAVDDIRHSVAGPAWLDAVGGATPTRAWIASDVFGDQDSLIVGFAQPGEAGEHAIVALVDHNLSGQAKDAWIAGDLDEVVSSWKSTDLWNGDTEFAHRGVRPAPCAHLGPSSPSRERTRAAGRRPRDVPDRARLDRR